MRKELTQKQIEEAVKKVKAAREANPVSNLAFWLGDLHCPDHDEKTIKPVLQYVSDRKPNTIILGGDIGDFNSISSHNAGNLRAIAGRTVRKEYDSIERFLDQVQTAAPEAKIYYLEGNHEYRIERWINANPQLEGIMEVPTQLKLKERGIIWVPSWSETRVLKIGKANFVHGLYTSKYHTARMVEVFNANVFGGHTHDVQCFPKVSLGENNTHVGQTLGCLCKYNQSYLKGKPTKWQQAFGEFHFRKDGYFNYYIPHIFNHKFVAPTGELYK